MKKVFFILMAAVLFSGCSLSSLHRTDGVGMRDGYLIVDNKCLSADVAIVGDRTGRNEFDFFHVQVVVKNATINDFRCQYQITWYDENGLLLTHASSPWKDIMFYGKEEKAINAVCPVPAGKDYRLSVRR